MADRSSGVIKENPEIRDGFKFIAGHVALDLPGTLAGRIKPPPRELLACTGDLARWLVAAELAGSAPKVSAADLDHARRLRECIYGLALARVNRQALPDAARRELNQLAARTAAVPQLDRDSRSSLSGTAQALLSSIARDAIILLGGETSQRLRQCEGETCALLFLDSSRRGDRRWCSMSGCGNKAKVADFRRRQRADP
jgi:predicted RNA-binding Zn ribbon-like protein